MKQPESCPALEKIPTSVDVRVHGGVANRGGLEADVATKSLNFG